MNKYDDSGSCNATLCKIFAFLFLTALFSGSAHAREGADLKLCKFFIRSRFKAVLLDSKSRIVKRMDMGALSMRSSPHDQDFVLSTERYRLIVFPKHLEVQEGCSMADCYFKKAVEPRCRGTSDHEIWGGIVAHKFGPGNFENDLLISVIDPNLDFPDQIDVNFLFEKK